MSNRIQWHLTPESRETWPHGLPDSLPDLLQRGQAQTIKDGPFRTIYRAHLSARDVHIKHCRPAGLRAWLREWIRPAKARLEFSRIVEASGRNVPTLRPIAWGRAPGWTPGDSFLLTHSLVDATPFGRFLTDELQHLSEPRRSAVRQLLAVQFGFFMAQLHEAGIAHPDLHPGNVLLHWVDNTPRFVLIDLHDVAVGAPLSLSASRRNLALVNGWFRLRTSASDRLRFFKAYQQTRLMAFDHEEARAVEEETHRVLQRFWNSRAWRCLGTNRYFVRWRNGCYAGSAERDLDLGMLSAWFGPPQVQAEAAIRVWKDSRSVLVTEHQWTSQVGGQCAILKRFRGKSIWRRLVSRVRPSACRRSWANGHGFLDALLPTPRPLAVWQRQTLGLPAEEFLLVEKIDRAFNLHEVVAELAKRPKGERTRAQRANLRLVAAWIRQMHERGWTHRDLKASNLLISEPLAASARFWFIDLVGARRIGTVSDRRRWRDLARLNASFAIQPGLPRTDRLRFLRSYLQWHLRGREGWKIWWKQIACLTDAKAKRNADRGRPLA